VKITHGAWLAVKIAAARKMNTCSRAEHSDTGITSMVSSRSARERMIRVPIAAGTLQPKPSSSITKPRPSSPSRAMNASVRNAARDRYRNPPRRP
jgi:hypothetical protein